jgi:hypothetical protein
MWNILTISEKILKNINPVVHSQRRNRMKFPPSVGIGQSHKRTDWVLSIIFHNHNSIWIK